MYDMINTQNDVLKEKYIYGADLVGEYGFPQLTQVNAYPEDLKPVPFSNAIAEKRPRDCVCHFFIDDSKFERIWNNGFKYVDILQNFKYVCTPDFSFYSDMPRAMQIWQVYRSRTLAFWLGAVGIKIIPTVSWSDEESFEYCFDGLPRNSTLAVSTNGCFSKEGMHYYRKGFLEMCDRLNPSKVLVVGRKIDVDVGVDIVYLDSFGMSMTKRLRG